VLFFGVVACSRPEAVVSMQEVRVVRGATDNFLSVDVLATEDGKAIPCDQGEVEISVAISDDEDGPFKDVSPSDLTVTCTDEARPDFGLTVDNSGSEKGRLDWLQVALRNVLSTIEPMGGRASLVRVSTNAEVRRELTDDLSTLDDDIGELTVANGWTALYDGIRMANDTLGDGYMTTSEPDDVGSFCASGRKTGVVVFTDAQENNSSDQELVNDEYPGDGIDTTLGALKELKVNGVPTPIYTVGLGWDVDHEALEELAEETGGRHHRVDDEEDLPEVYELITEYAFSNVKVCMDLPRDMCGTYFARIRYSWQRCENGECDGQRIEGEQIYEVTLDCRMSQQGSAATALLTFSNPGIEEDVARDLAAQIVEWVSPTANPKVLVVEDDNHRDEFPEDAEYVADLLEDIDGIDEVDFLEEPKRGLELEKTEGYDVVWLSNPGYPPDDRKTLYTLQQFAENGGGYVLQGDDMTWFWGDRGFSMTPLTGLVHKANGTRFCRKRIDNNDTDRRYLVSMEETDLPLKESLQGLQFKYGDDIDTSSLASEGTPTLVASAVGLDKNGEVYCDEQVPVIVLRKPDSLGD
jgi:hypothetical protein